LLLAKPPTTFNKGVYLNTRLLALIKARFISEKKRTLLVLTAFANSPFIAFKLKLAHSLPP
jgi:hypothetical protein